MFDIVNTVGCFATKTIQPQFIVLPFIFPILHIRTVRESVREGDEARAFFTDVTRQSVLAMYESGRRVRDLEYLGAMPEGKPRWVRMELHFLSNPMDGHVLLMALLRSIDENGLTRSELRRAADTDAMTGLMNREETMRGIEGYLAGEGAKGVHALFMIDLDNFKVINDSFGHQMGDEVLCHISGVLRHCFRQNDIVGRIGGDEFFALMKDAGKVSLAVRKANELLEALQYVCSSNGKRAELSASVGIALCHGDREPLEALYARVDNAMYGAKRSGRNQYVFSDSQNRLLDHTELPRDSSNAINLRSLLENMDGAIFVAEAKDDELRLTYASQSLFTQIGRTPEEVGSQGENALSVVVGEDLPTLRGAILRTLRTGEPLECDFRTLMKGETKWRHVRGSRMPVAEDGGVRALGVVTDVSALKRDAERLAFAELRYRTAMEQSSMVLGEFDLRLDSARFTGPRAEALGYGDRVFAHPPESIIEAGFISADTVDVYRRMYADMRAGDDGKSYAFVIVDKAGQERPVLSHFRLLRDEAGAPYYAISVTEPLLNDRELALYRTLSKAGVFCVRMDADFTLLYGNDRFYAIFGYTHQSLRHLHDNACARIIHPDDLPDVRRTLDEALASGMPRAEWIMRMLTARGEVRYVQTTCEFVRQSDGTVALNGVALDVTARRLGELALEEQRAQMNKRYISMLSMRDAAEQTLVSSAYLNLSRNAVLRDPNGDAPPFEGSIDEMLERNCRNIADEEECRRVLAAFNRQALLAAYRRGETQASVTLRYRLQDERTLWLTTTVAMAENPATGDVECLLYSRDVDAEQNLQRMIRRIMDVDYEFLGLYDCATLRFIASWVEPNASARDCAGRTLDEAIAEICERMVLPEYRERFLQALNHTAITRALERRDVYMCDFPAVGDDGAPRRVQFRCGYLDASRSSVLLSRSDVTALYAAETDALTTLYSRQAFYKHAREALAANPDTAFTLLCVDLDRFKVYNDAFGAKEGDRLLTELGRALRRRFGDEAYPARLDADHFVLLLKRAELDVEAECGRLLSWLAHYTSAFRLTASIGVYDVNQPELEIQQMCDRALLALRTVKHSYTRKIGYYDESLSRQLMEEQLLIDEMEIALREGQFVLYFQPQVNYETGALLGAEALVRWKHPTRGVLTPGTFVPLFERNGFISKLDEYVWERCCAYLRKWRDERGSALPISVSANVSRLDIYDRDLAGKLKGMVEKYDLPPSLLKLEITESAYMENPRQLIRVVRDLQAAGFSVEMDDFGSGYSSLNTLKDVPVDVLKLDVQFLNESADNARSGSILSSVIRMAHWLKLPVIVEGVETYAQAEYLRSLNCFYMQGYYFGRPMPAKAFEELLDRNRQEDFSRYRNVDLAEMADFWDMSMQNTLLFNAMLGGAAILELRGGHVEVQRANDRFYRELNTTREDYADKQLDTLARFDELNRARYLHMLEEAIRTGDEADCDTESLPQTEGEERFWIHNRVRCLCRSDDAYLFCLSVENVTERIRAHQERSAST